MTYPQGHKRALETRGAMHVRHYRLKLAGNDTAIAGCGCRGCTWARRKLANSQVQPVMQDVLNRFSRRFAA